MERLEIIILFIILSTIVLPFNPLVATKGNEGFVNQNMVNADFNISSLVYDLISKPMNISYADWTE